MNSHMPSSGRRERNKQDKHERILRAATRLIDERGIAAVTTQAVAQEADVGAGTLFQYAASKAELLVMTHNPRFSAAVDEGWAAQAAAAGARERVLALFAPVVACNRRQPENGRAYLLELTFGDPATPYRAAAHQIVATLHAHVETILVDTGATDPQRAPDSARVIFAIFYLAVSSARNDRRTTSIMEEIDRQLTAHVPDST